MTEPARVVPALNLLDEPWVPVRLRSGEVMELGLLELFERAADVEALAETSPPNLVAMYRLLLAITHRALTHKCGHWTDVERAHWYANGLPARAAPDYLTRWRDRFWLFHPEHPFMQVAALSHAEETREKVKPWTQISLVSVNGNNPVMFDHSLDTSPSAIAATAALRDLLGFQQFTPGGLVKVLRTADNGGPLANTAAVLAIGKSLQETLLLGLHPSRPRETEDLPTWEAQPTSIAMLRAEATPATGHIDRYTRLTRAVLLIAADDTSSTVQWLHLAAGLSLKDDTNAPDAMNPCRQTEEGPKPLRFSQGRAVWRDLAALLPDDGQRVSLPAASLTWASNLMNELDVTDKDIRVLVAGIASDKAKILRLRAETFVLPVAALCQSDFAQVVRTHLKDAEDLFKGLRGIAENMLALSMPDSGSKDTWKRARAALECGPCAATFFSTAERALPNLLQQIGGGNLEEAHAHWSATLLRAAQAGWEAARGMLGQSTAALRAEATTHGKFLRLIQPLRPAPAPGNATAASSPTQEVSA